MTESKAASTWHNPLMTKRAERTGKTRDKVRGWNSSGRKYAILPHNQGQLDEIDIG